jgi:hypothetical protein
MADQEPVFLYEPEGTERVGGTAPRFTRAWIAEDGLWRLGFDASQLAAAFSVPIETIFDANRGRTFMLDATEDVEPSHGGHKAKRYIFSLGPLKRAIIIEADPPAVSGYSSQ